MSPDPRLMDMTFSTEDLAFRDEVRAFLDICAHACRSACWSCPGKVEGLLIT